MWQEFLRFTVSATYKYTMSEWVSEVTQSCPTLCDPMDCSLPDSSIHGIFQARILEWVAISFSRRSSWSRDWTQVSHIVGRRFIVWGTREARILHYSVYIAFIGTGKQKIHVTCFMLTFAFSKWSGTEPYMSPRCACKCTQRWTIRGVTREMTH